MKTLIISSSLSEYSKSFILCKEIEKRLMKNKNVEVEFVDLKEYDLNPTHREKTKDMEKLSNLVDVSDNLVISMGVHCYSINDSLKIILDNCFSGAKNKFYGILCAAGGEKSYLATMNLTQICMNEYRMIQLPRVIYASGKDFNQHKIVNADLFERLDDFSKEFFEIGKKLLS